MPGWWRAGCWCVRPGVGWRVFLGGTEKVAHSTGELVTVTLGSAAYFLSKTQRLSEGAPAEYRGQTNPYESSEEAVAEGRQLYATHCELCHGSEGLGNGETANSLSPSPALLAHLIQMPMAVDDYLLWSISEGGTEFGTGMPAFKEVLSREQI